MTKSFNFISILKYDFLFCFSDFPEENIYSQINSVNKVNENKNNDVISERKEKLLYSKKQKKIDSNVTNRKNIQNKAFGDEINDPFQQNKNIMLFFF